MTDTDPHLLLLRLQKLYWVLRQPQRAQFLRYRLAPSLEHADLLSKRHFTTVIDVGANVGQFAIFAVERLGSTNLVCVEPQPDALGHLPKLLQPYGCQLTVAAVAFSDHTSVEQFNVTRARDSSSLLVPVGTGGTSEGGLRVTRRLTVPVVVGDEALGTDHPGPVLLKVDVQGSEMQVLRGLTRSLHWIDSVLIEVSFDELYEHQTRPQDVIDFLRAHGFYLAAAAPVPGSRGGWRMGQADLLFERVRDE